MIKLATHEYNLPIVLAPLAGISDRPFRSICRAHGADYAVTEMIASDPTLRRTEKSIKRADLENGSGLKVVQIAGAEPLRLSETARYAVDIGADVVDINMGCPAKKVCNQLAGSALMRDEKLVARLLEAVVNAVSVPVTLKMRSGWNQENKNAVTLARLAERVGISGIAVHGRTRACGFKGTAEYQTVKAVKHAVDIPVLANGDIDSAEKAKRVLEDTQCDGLLIGRAAQGNPWIFRRIKAALNGELYDDRLSPPEVLTQMREHLLAAHAFYGPIATRIVRKHITAYCEHLEQGAILRREFNTQNSLDEQLAVLERFSDSISKQIMDREERFEFRSNNTNGALAA